MNCCWRLNTGFAQALAAVAALGKHKAFEPAELHRFAALVQEARAATNSYVTSVIEIAETAEAGRHFRKRLRREWREEQGR